MDAKTLVELLDERPLENVLGVEIFRPEQVVYVCPEGTAKHAEKQLEDYFRHRGLRVRLAFREVNIYDTGAVLAVFRAVLREHPEAVMDITGGTDAVLFAAGLACAEAKIPVVTYSRTQRRLGGGLFPDGGRIHAAGPGGQRYPGALYLGYRSFL